jgi:hypothetical protein
MVVGGLGAAYLFQQRQAQGAARERAIAHLVTLLKEGRDRGYYDPGRWQAALAAVEQSERSTWGDAEARDALAGTRQAILSDMAEIEHDRILLARLVDIRSAEADDIGGPATEAAYLEAFRDRPGPAARPARRRVRPVSGRAVEPGRRRSRGVSISGPVGRHRAGRSLCDTPTSIDLRSLRRSSRRALRQCEGNRLSSAAHLSSGARYRPSKLRRNRDGPSRVWHARPSLCKTFAARLGELLSALAPAGRGMG